MPPTINPFAFLTAHDACSGTRRSAELCSYNFNSSLKQAAKAGQHIQVKIRRREPRVKHGRHQATQERTYQRASASPRARKLAPFNHPQPVPLHKKGPSCTFWPNSGQSRPYPHLAERLGVI